MDASRTILFAGVELFDGDRTLPGRMDLTIQRGIIQSIRPAGSAAGTPVPGLVIAGGAVLPGIVDAHVHISFASPWDVVAGGVTGALDLGEPIELAFADHAPLRLRAAGPLLTAPGGYPTKSWGAGGFGWEIKNETEARAAVKTLAERGAAVIKVALEGDPCLDATVGAVIAREARDHGLTTVAHALTEPAVRLALDCGVDALAHTPAESIAPEVAAECGRRRMTVISTVRAFGVSRYSRASLTRLHYAGCRIVYGTDLGNDGIRPGLDVEEMQILQSTLGSRDAALHAATAASAEYAGFPLASIAPGSSANLMRCASLDYADIASPTHVFIDGTAVITPGNRA